MSQADIYTKNYISQNDIFADVFNFFIYGGEQVIKPQSLSEENTQEDVIMFIGVDKEETTQRYRDVLKSFVRKRGKEASYTALVLNSQTNIGIKINQNKD